MTTYSTNKGGGVVVVLTTSALSYSFFSFHGMNGK